MSYMILLYLNITYNLYRSIIYKPISFIILINTIIVTPNNLKHNQSNNK